MEGYPYNENHPFGVSYSIWLDLTLIFLIPAGIHQQGLIATLAYALSSPLAGRALLQFCCVEIWPWSCVHSQGDGSRCWGRQCDLPGFGLIWSLHRPFKQGSEGWICLSVRESRSILQTQRAQRNADIQASEVLLLGDPRPVTEPNWDPSLHVP